jgi:hypothetical protein
VISQFHIIFTFYLDFHIFVSFLGLGPRSRPQNLYFFTFLVIFFYIIFILCENLVFRLVHTDNLYKAQTKVSLSKVFDVLLENWQMPRLQRHERA